VSEVKLNVIDIRDAIVTLDAARKLLLQRGQILLTSALDILKSIGWDPKSPHFKLGLGTVLDESKHFKHITAKAYINFGRISQGLGIHTRAIEAFKRVCWLFPMWMSPFIEIVRSEICCGRFKEARDTLNEICFKEYKGLLPWSPSVVDLMSVNKDLAVFLIIIEGSQIELNKVKNRGRLILPVLQSSNVISIPLPHDTVLGRPIDHDLKLKKAKVIAARHDEEEKVLSSRDNLMRRLNKVRSRALALSDEVKILAR
jgi:hypothetical protein